MGIQTRHPKTLKCELSSFLPESSYRGEKSLSKVGWYLRKVVVCNTACARRWKGGMKQHQPTDVLDFLYKCFSQAILRVLVWY